MCYFLLLLSWPGLPQKKISITRDFLVKYQLQITIRQAADRDYIQLPTVCVNDKQARASALISQWHPPHSARLHCIHLLLSQCTWAEQENMKADTFNNMGNTDILGKTGQFCTSRAHKYTGKLIANPLSPRVTVLRRIKM